VLKGDRKGQHGIRIELGTSPKLWLNLQSAYELRVARQNKLKEIEEAVKPRVAA